MDINPSFIVDIHFHLACAVGDNKSLMLQLVLPPEYYTLRGQPIVPWEWLALPNGVIFKGAWEAWEHTRLHMSLDAYKVSDWDDATKFGLDIISLQSQSPCLSPQFKKHVNYFALIAKRDLVNNLQKSSDDWASVLAVGAPRILGDALHAVV